MVCIADRGKNCFFFVGILKATDKKSRIRICKSVVRILVSGSGSISQLYESAGPDPDPYQNVTDPQHWFSKPFRMHCKTFPQSS
jgi:hypothetical protein